MRFTLLICVASCCMAATAIGQLSEDEQKHIASSQRRTLKLEDTVSRIKKGDVSPRKLTIVWQILRHTNEARSHQLGLCTVGLAVVGVSTLTPFAEVP